MPFGLTNAPATFQSLIHAIFRPRLRQFIVVFFDDILVYSKSWEEHLLHLSKALEILQQHRLFFKKQKCSFGQRQVEYLGHIVLEKGYPQIQRRFSPLLIGLLPENLFQLMERFAILYIS